VAYPFTALTPLTFGTPLAWRTIDGKGGIYPSSISTEIYKLNPGSGTRQPVPNDVTVGVAWRRKEKAPEQRA